MAKIENILGFTFANLPKICESFFFYSSDFTRA